ncbi:MAG: GGDEF domain-containing protein [Pseudomonas sp.]|nr:GGDEF domain-containing protein [Pseudomonas sp.]
MTKLSLALARLHAQQRTPIDAILVDLTLPDSQGLATFNRLFVQASGISIMTLSELALLFIDLDNVKDINDSLDHNIGDQLLQAVALRLCSCVRSADTLSPSGGDEFVVLLEQNHSEEDATRTAEKIREALASTVEIAQQTLHISASIGIST